MDKGEAVNIANLYINSISNKYAILQAFHFGSFAKGTYHDVVAKKSARQLCIGTK